jgi:DNA-binding transcriptional LysR family regulator
MEFRQLKYAIRIASEKNFSRAAEKLHIAQPSLSQQLAKLEKEIGVTLFHRNTNSVELTHAGALFVGKAQKIVDMVEQLKKEMEDISQMKKGKLIVGSLPMTGAHILPRVLPAYRARYPQIEIVLMEDTTDNLEALAASGQTDVCLLSLPLADRSLEYTPIIEEELALAVPPAHPLAAERQPVEIAALVDEPFIVLKKGHGFRRITFDLCEKEGFTPNIVFESSNIETVQSLVAAGMGIAFVPRMVARGADSEFAPVYVSLAIRPKRTLVIAYRKGRYLSRAAEAFIATMREVMDAPTKRNEAESI